MAEIHSQGGIMRNKVTVVGAGHVGATTAQRIAESNLADVVLVDIYEGVAKGKALDLMEAGPVMGYDSCLTGTRDYADTAKSDIVVITAGVARKPGMSRDDLLKTNFKVVSDVTREIAAQSPNAILILVTNPLDIMAYTALKVSGFPSDRVIGMAGVLDSARFRAFIAMELKVSVENVSAFVLGGHGDSMVPLARYSTVAGIPLPDVMDDATIERLVTRTRGGGAEIVKFLEKGSAYYAPSASVYDMVSAILLDKHKILPCAAFAEGHYGLEGLYVGVPCQLGRKGLEKIWEIQLTEAESTALKASAEHVKANLAKLDL